MFTLMGRTQLKLGRKRQQANGQRPSSPPSRLSVIIVGPRRQHQGGITRAIDSWLGAGLGDAVNVEVSELAAWDAPPLVQAMQSAVGLLKLAMRLVRRRSRPALIHLQVSSGASLYRKYAASLLGRSAGVPCVVHLHSGGFQGWIESNRFHRTIARRLIGRASATIVVAGHWQPLAEQLGSGSAHVIPHMLSAKVAEQLTCVRTDRLPRSSQYNGRLSVLYYGRWARIKGLDLLAEAVAELNHKSKQRLELRVFGNGDRDWAERLFRRCDPAEVRIGGWLTDSNKADELAYADIVVVPSRHEAFGASLLEIMAAGAPLIASDAGAIPEVLGPYPLARIMRSDSVTALRDALQAFVDGAWPPPSAQRPAALPDRYAPHAVVAQLVNVYQGAGRSC